MMRLAFAVLAVALAGVAQAGWRSLRIDGSSQAAFETSVAALQEELSPAHRQVFDLALLDIWLRGTQDDAQAAQREYTGSDYFRQLDGLGYDEVVTLLDPTGKQAKTRYREARDEAYARSRGRRPPNRGVGFPQTSAVEKQYPTRQQECAQSQYC
jgi:hypothetical protein